MLSQIRVFTPLQSVNFYENISIMLWTVMHSDNHYSLTVVKMGWISPFYSPKGRSWRDSVHQDGITSFLWNKTVKLFGRSGAGAMEFIKTDKPLWDRMLSSPPSPSWILPHIQWSIHWPIGNCLSPSSHGKLSLTIITWKDVSLHIWEAVSLHHHSRTNGHFTWPFSFTTSGPLHHHCFIPLINRQVDQWCKSSLHQLPSWSI